MIDRSITDAEFGRDYLGGRSSRTARRRIVEDGIPHQRDRGHWLIRQSDADAWREERLTAAHPLDLKAFVASISKRVLERRSS